MDLEIHTVHLASEKKEGFNYAALGVMFDRKNYDKGVTKKEILHIDNFFDDIMKGGYKVLEVE